MVGRVSFNSNYNLMVQRIQDVSARYRESLNTATSGKSVNGPSDDPGSYRRIESGRAQLQQYDDYRKGVGNAMQEMYTAESTLGSIYDRLIRARELAVAGATTGYDAANRATMAEEVGAIWDDVLLMSNATFNDRYIFAGNLYDQPAYDATATYQGDANQRNYLAGLNYSVPVSMTGDEIFGTAAGGVDIFATLTALETALNANNPTTVQATLTDLDLALGQIEAARATYGVRAGQAEALKNLYADSKVTTLERISQDEDVDAAQAITDLTRLQTAFQATLQVSASAKQVSLLNYI
ncbi:MAG: flagellin [Myxococcota bacterium]